jgi:hypothetical protein
MEYETWELLEKFIDEIDTLILCLEKKLMTNEEFIQEIKNYKTFYENEIH